jgi:hypothetical protein
MNFYFPIVWCHLFGEMFLLLLSPGYLLKKSAKNNEWSRRWFVLNEKSGKVNKSPLRFCPILNILNSNFQYFP